MCRGKVCALWAILLVLSGSMKAEFQVNEYTEHHQTHAAVSMNAAGEFAVVWRSHVADGRGGGVYARCFDAEDNPIGPEFKVNTSQIDVDNWKPAVAVGPTGDLVVVWVALREGQCDVLARMFDLQGLALTDEFQIGEPTSQAGESMPAVAMDPTGNFVVLWTSWSDGRYLGRSHIMGRVYRPDGSPRSAVFRVSDKANANWADVGMDQSGRFVVSWIRMGDTFNRPYGEYIFFRQFEADGTPLGDVVAVTDDLNSRWYGPAVAVDRSGDFVIAWAIGPFPYDILAQHFAPDGTAATPPYMINTCAAGNQGHPRVATDGDGAHWIVWDSEGQDGSCSGVFGQQCSRDGTFTGEECPINTFVLGRQWYPDVAMSAGGRYVVIWLSENQDGSGYGVFGQTGTR